jgi:hypothetical protein
MNLKIQQETHSTLLFLSIENLLGEKLAVATSSSTKENLE